MRLTNLYSPPTSEVVQAVPSRLRPGRQCYLWLVAYGLNLVVPTIIASQMIDTRGWLGLIGAVVLMGVSTFIFLTWRQFWAGPAMIGAFLMAITQLMPIVQMMVGMTATVVASKLTEGTGARSPVSRFIGQGGFENPFGVETAFLATFGTGLPLLAASIIVGFGVQLLSRESKNSAPTITSTTT